MFYFYFPFTFLEFSILRNISLIKNEKENRNSSFDIYAKNVNYFFNTF